jgi:hypothetical protein
MSIPYRPEIDGLRTVSVMLVILHHLGWSLLPGGYVGVDVFFVISGYLITQIVSAEIRGGTFSIGNFYKRRIMRLAPAYFLVLAATTIASVLVMLPAELLDYFESVIYSTFFSANFYMWQEVGVTSVRNPNSFHCSTCGRWLSRSSFISSGRLRSWCCSSSCPADFCGRCLQAPYWLASLFRSGACRTIAPPPIT